jgi:hypothetical protein
MLVGFVSNGLNAESPLVFNFSGQDALIHKESVDLNKETLDFENTADQLNGIDVFRFDDEGDDYDFICNQLPIIQPARWKLVLGNLTGAVVLRWNALGKFVGRHWDRLTKKSSKKKLVRNRKHA